MRELALVIGIALMLFGLIYVAVRLLWALIIRPLLAAAIGAALICLALLASPSHAATFELSVVIESADDRAAADEAVNAAAAIYRAQLGVELVATVREVSTVAGHTKPEALLDALKQYRLDRPTLRATDATVLFTRRELTRGYEGIATIGPSCSAAAAAIVRLRNDGLDGEVLAHEVAHTVGVPHDAQPGYLMSESVARSSAPNFSADSVLTFKAAPADCMESPKPAAAVSVPTVASSPTTGGGGSADWFTLGALVVLALLTSWCKIKSDRLQNELVNAKGEIAKLVNDAAPEFALRDVVGVWAPPSIFDDDERILLVKFTTYACMADFQKWLNTQRRRAKANTYSENSER